MIVAIREYLSSRVFKTECQQLISDTFILASSQNHMTDGHVTGAENSYATSVGNERMGRLGVLTLPMVVTSGVTPK